MARLQPNARTDLLLAAAARALSSGDPLAALKVVALRDDAPSLALRGTALAQLGDFERAKILLRRAARLFGTRQPVARARCRVAEAEIALASRDLAWPRQAMAAAEATLVAHGDHANAAHARLLEARHLLLVGQIDTATQLLDQLDPSPLPPALRAAHELARAGIAMRRVHAGVARDALQRARRAALRAGIPALAAEVECMLHALDAPAARRVQHGESRMLRLCDVEALLASPALVVDGCRYAAHHAANTIPLATRPVLFTLLRMLAEAWPDDVPRNAMVAGAFRLRETDESARARLRVELGRLRKVLLRVAEVRATARGFALAPRLASEVVVLARPAEERHATLLALLADGESWSSSALATALGSSQRKVQRALESLAADGKINAMGRGRARRWLIPSLPGFTTILLLPSPLANA